MADLKIIHQQIADFFWHVIVNGNLHHRAKFAAADTGLHTFKQIVGFQFLDLDIGIADNAEWISGNHFHTGEQSREIGSNNLFEPDKIMMVRDCAVLARRPGRAFDRHKARQSVWHLYAGKFLIAILIPDHDGEVQAQIRDMREGMARVKGRGSEDREGNFLEVNDAYCALTGYGDTGPLRDRAGYDQVLQTMTGICVEQGKPGDPEIVYGSAVDFYCASMLARSGTYL